MNRRRDLKMLRQAFRTSGVDHIFSGYLGYFVLMAFVIWLFKPTIPRFIDSLWYCFAVATTVGFGDYTATTILCRVMTIVLSIYSIAVVSIFTAVVTGFFMDLAKRKASDSAREFLYDLTHLPGMSKDELREMSERVRKFVNKQ